MLEEAKLDDLFNLICSETGQEIHKLMQVIASIDDEEKLEKLINEADSVRRLRQMHERDFFGVENSDVERFRRSGIGEGGCDFKHCCINFMCALEVAQKEIRMYVDTNDPVHKKKALEYLRTARKKWHLKLGKPFGGGKWK